MNSENNNNQAVLELAWRGLGELSALDVQLNSLFIDLERLDPELAARAEAVFGDRALAASLLYGPVASLGGKSVMLVALETGRDPFEVLPNPRNNRTPESVASDDEAMGLATQPALRGTNFYYKVPMKPVAVNGRAAEDGNSDVFVLMAELIGCVPKEQAHLFVRCYRSLYALTGGDSRQMAHWLHTENYHTGGVPAIQVKAEQGLAIVLEYLEGLRAKL